MNRGRWNCDLQRLSGGVARGLDGIMVSRCSNPRHERKLQPTMESPWYLLVMWKEFGWSPILRDCVLQSLKARVRGRRPRLQSVRFDLLAIFNRSRSQSGKPLLEVWHYCPFSVAFDVTGIKTTLCVASL